MSNVKAGDLAVVVNAWNVPENLGRVVRVVRFYGNASFKSGLYASNCWLVQGNIATFSGAPFCAFSRSLGVDACIPDFCLRPIRDPGDDAQDESKAWLPPVPTKEHA